MGMHSSESIASSAHGLEHLPIKDGVLNTENEQDDLLQAPSLEAGIFGVLFTLSQEKNQQHIRYHWILLKILLDSWQLYTTVMEPKMGWDIDPDSIAWRIVNVLSFQWLATLGYTWYVVVLYSMAALLAVNLALCVWVAWSFKEQKFDYVWPIKVVRGFSYVFLQVFDITSLNFLQLGISCNYVGPVQPHFHMALFPSYSCATTPHIINAIVSGLLLVLFVAVAMLVNMSEVEVNPASKTPTALGHGGAEVTAFGIKALMTMVGVFLGWPKVAAVAYLLLSMWLAWLYLRWVPHLQLWINCLKSGVAVTVFGVAALQVVVLSFRDVPGGSEICDTLTYAMAISLGPMFVVGAGVAWLRTKLFVAAVLKAFKTADPEAIKPQDIYHFYDPRDVEVAARSARVWTDLYNLEKTAVHRAESIIKAGIAVFPDDAFVSIVYADFMLDILGFSQTGAKQLEAVRKLSPGIMVRFMLFVRQQQATQKAASSTVGRGGNMDLLGYVEYQRKQRMVLRHHKDALQAMANFWRILGSSTVSFTSLSNSLEEIDTSVSQAETAYRVVLELYNNSPKLVRLYARFLETIKQDPWAAAEYHAVAERLEENKDEDGQGPVLPDGTPISRMDDVEKGVLMVNAFGDIQVANRKCYSMFGYKKGELDGKNVTVLMPPHEAKRHPGILRRYIDSGDKAVPYFRHPVLALHRERVAFTIRIAVSRASGVGEDSVFIGIVEPVATEPGLGRLWVTREGVIVCCDPGFVTCFGYLPEDVISTQLDKLLRPEGYDTEQARSADVWVMNQASHDNHELVQRLLDSALEYGSGSIADQPMPPQLSASVLHKYDFAKAVSISVRADISKSAIFELRMQLQSNEPQLLMVVERKGAIRHMSGDLAKILGVGLTDSLSGARVNGGGGNPGGGSGQDGQGGAEHMQAEDQVMLELMSDEPQRSLDDFLPSPWKLLHHKYRKYTVTGSSSLLAGAWGCRAAASPSGDTVGPTMRLVGLHGKPVFVHLAVLSREEDGEAMHVVRMARSSLETAIAERRLRLRVAEDGTVEEVCLPSPITTASTDSGPDKAVTELFGFPSDQIVGCRLWDFIALQSDAADSAAATVINGGGADAWPPRKKSSFGGAVGSDEGAQLALATMGRSLDGSLAKGPRGNAAKQASAGLNFQTYDGMITSSLQTPGVSWRVSVAPPSAVTEAAAMGNPARAAAVLAQRTKHAVMRLDVALPSASAGAKSASKGKLLVHAELWTLEAVTGVVEVNASGRISSILEEDIRPPGLLFGLPKEELLGAQLGALIKLGPGQSAPGLLTESGVTKKSSLKSSSRKGRLVEKVGPIHYLDGFHRDNKPLHLVVQVVGKPGPANPIIAIIRIATDKLLAAQRAKKHASTAPGPPPPTASFATAVAAAAAGGTGTGARKLSTNGSMNSRGRVVLDLGAAGGGNDAASDLSDSGMAQLRLRSRDDAGAAADMPTPSLKALAASYKTRPSNDGAKKIDPDGGAGGIIRSATSMPVTPGQSSPQLGGLSASSLKPLPLPRATLDMQPAGSAQPPGTPSRLPGPRSVAASVESMVKGKTPTVSSSKLEVPRTGTPPISEGGAAPAAVSADSAIATAAVAAAGAGTPPGTPPALADDGGANAGHICSPVTPESPRAGTPSKRSVLSPRTEARLLPDGAQGAAAGPSRLSLESGPIVTRGGGARGDRSDDDVSLEKAILALGGEADGGGSASDKNGADKGLGGVDKWVATGGDFYRNKVRSTDGMAQDPDGEDEEDDDDGSLDATSRATSSHWASPRASGCGLPGEIPEQPGAPLNFHHHGQHAQHPPFRHPGGGGEGVAAGGPGGFGHPASRFHTHAWGAPDGREPGWGGQGPGQGYMKRFQQGQGGGGGGVGVGAGVSPEAAPGDELADDRSDGGESALSGFSGVSGVSDSNAPADFKRGKRYRKLVKLMDSPQAQKAVVRLKVNTGIALFAACAVHVLCFVFIITAVKRQSVSLDRLSMVGGAQRYFQRAVVSVRALDVSYQGRGNNMTYDITDTTAFANDLMTYTTKFKEVQDDLLISAGNQVEEMFYTTFIETWSGYNATTHQQFYEKITLWDMITRSFVSAKSVFQNHVTWHQQGLNISSMLPAEFLIRSGQDLVLGMGQIITRLLDDAVSRTNYVNVLQLTFLILEGCLVASVCAGVLMYILRSACEQRYQLYETFLKIPVGLTKALASQTTHLLDDDESEEEEDEDAGSVVRGGTEEGAAVSKRKALFDDNAPGTSPLLGCQAGRQGAAAQLLSPNRAGGGGGGGGGGSRAVQKKNDSVKGYLHGGGGDSGTWKGGGDASGWDSSLINGYHYALLLSGDGRDTQPQKPQGFWARLKFWRSGAVQPTDGGDSARRTLGKDSNVTTHMFFILIAYSLLIILFYSIAYAVLLGVQDMVALQAVADHTTERAYRTVFYAQELAAEWNVSALPDRISGVRDATVALRDAYYTLRMGGAAGLAVGPHVEVFPLVAGSGITKDSPAIFDAFYANDVCLRLQEHFPCPSAAFRFFQVTRSGLDGMMTQMLLELKYIADEAEAELIHGGNQSGLASPRWDYIYNVGTMDIADANILVSTGHMSNIKAVFEAVVIMHVVLFLLLLCVFICFLTFVYVPLLRRMTKEKRRIAEMMSQLPPELDVMKLVSAALLGAKYINRNPSGEGRRASMAPNVSIGAAAAAAAVGANTGKGAAAADEDSQGSRDADASPSTAAATGGGKAYQAWKDILNRATNVNAAAAVASGGSIQSGKRLGSKV